MSEEVPVKYDPAAFKYPSAPGWKEPSTSRDAAVKIASKAETLCQRVLIQLDLRGPMTPDECAEYLRETVLAIRPRFSELAKSGAIQKTGKRRLNASGMAAHVWRVA